jgi:OOP family OmpA-OmpF porin
VVTEQVVVVCAVGNNNQGKKMKKSKPILAALALAAAAVAGPAAADDKGLYLGGSAGHVEYQETCTRLNLAAGCRDHDEGWRAFGGYRWNRNFALELGFADLGTASGFGDLGFGPITEEISVRAFDLVAVLSFQIANRLSLFGKLGGYRARTSHDIVTGTGTLQGGDSDAGLTYGAGIGFDLGPLGLRLEWQRYDNVGGSTTAGEENIDFFSLGALIRF